MSYLRNAWYVAAWANEIEPGKLLARTLLEEPVVLFRDEEGLPHALADRCPHRFAPLSMGALVDAGRSIQCVYHGLRFDAAGNCVLNPHGDGRIPQAAQVRCYPVVERYSAVWIWMGDPPLADPETIPDFSFNDPATWAVGTGTLVVDAPYELEIDNILDLSHIEFMHPLFASEAVRRAKVESRQEGDVVWSRRFMTDDSDVPDFLRQAFQVPEGPMDRWLDVRWTAPAHMALWAGGAASGRPSSQGVINPSTHCFTPERAGRSLYFYAVSYPLTMGPHAADLARVSVEAVRAPFELEDKPVVEAVAARMAGQALFDLKPVLLTGDAAAVRARRILQALIDKETGARY